MRKWIGLGIVAVAIFAGITWWTQPDWDTNMRDSRGLTRAEDSYLRAVATRVAPILYINTPVAAGTPLAHVLQQADMDAQSLQPPPRFAAYHARYLEAAHKLGLAGLKADRNHWDTTVSKDLDDATLEIAEAMQGMLAYITPVPAP